MLCKPTIARHGRWPMSSPISSAPGPEAAGSASLLVARPVQIKAGPSTYEALVGPGAIEQLVAGIERAGLKGRPRVIVDRVVWELYRPRLEAALAATGRDYQVLPIAGSEADKN